MNRYDHLFRSQPPFLKASGSQKVDYARTAIIEHRSNGFGPQDDHAVVQQFDLSGMDEFWEVELSEPLDCKTFIHYLAIHFWVMIFDAQMSAAQLKQCGPAANAHVNGIKVGLRQALREARKAGEPWFISRAETSGDPDVWKAQTFGRAVIVDSPVDGIDLSKLCVHPKAAAEWLLAKPKRRHLVPPSLVKSLQNHSERAEVLPKKKEVASKPSNSGRPKGTGYFRSDEAIAAEMLRLVAQGAHPSLTKAAEELVGRDGKGASGNGTGPSKTTRLVKRASGRE